MFKRVLIANRGEIALRVLRACRELDIEPVVVYSAADAEALHVQLAEQAYCIGPARAADSYLNMNAILTVAKAAGCDAIHPGYGFLSENDQFADACAEAGIAFIGPSGDVIRAMGNKAAARKMMMAANVPVVPGSDGAVETAQQAKEIADRIGYPVLIKASAGGGGRGMRRVFEPDQLIPLFEEARSESVACFGSGEMYLEKLILNPKHIEFQILADKAGNVIQLGDRDCSIQRRNQKMLEEAPSKALTPELREKMGAAAVAAAKAAGYENAGTIEFVLDQEGNFYFIEMNTRIQVEHPITEYVTGIDLVREQIRIAAGLPLSHKQEDVVLRGHAIECRINAEDPAKNFQPCPGKIDFLHLPGGCGVRVDTGLYTGCTLPPYYDSLMAKLIVWAPTRLEAIRRMRRVLEEMIIDGPANNADLLHQILYHPEFVRGSFTTAFLDENLDTLLQWSRAGDEEGKA
ncbi:MULTISPECIES: acetyl-CoA carboxylase biotin carboxylase subunit [unclassified Faecalibacterium]|uniref:acetyl-CoA carboxylase biotin carboxylase subunit n=1 Tax=unclassified Faecalibacterium TaxID=2646395 RepID=UPI000B367BFA|nr:MULTISPECIES: acetyl-CoA carboxylase biotin carboxylase subunit [unclassified Faecalibacterium]OUP26287.1 acetyl-CoA carboxylase biotin carboxylase subunit [Faecalibacterium sp. An192]OUQ35822.1 acetyl-CoA carboxylase biotin carboxylase subunit [Faecalibacterium sp. An122]